MKLFKTKTKKLQERIASLEQHIGVIYTTEDGYAEHLNREWGELPALEKRVKAVEEEKKGKK